MAYSTTNPPVVVASGIGTAMAIWTYTDGDEDSDINVSNYFSNGDDLGMKLGDMLLHNDTATPKGSVHYVSAVTAGGAATVSFAAVS